MSLHIIIDGYNLICQSDVLSSVARKNIQRSREVLLSRLAEYKRTKPHKITVVFDGFNAPIYSQRNDRFKGIEVRYSRMGELADSVIKRMAAHEKEKALIVSSDMEVVRFSENQGSATISSLYFEQKISSAIQLEMDKSWTDDEPESSIKITTQKKGPSRKLSKKSRRNRVKTDKL